MTNYHAHIYFQVFDLPTALGHFEALKRQPHMFRPWKVHSRPVGPHPMPNIELHFTSETKVQAVAWLTSNLNGWSVLVHEDTGDDIRDHTQGHFWLHRELPLNFEFFQLIQQDPSHMIHKN